MNKVTLCPWCQTEIVSNEQQGVDKKCPHCFNELDGYRSIHLSTFSLDNEEDGDKVEFIDVLQEDPELLEYEQAVEEYIKKQDEVPECGQCREYMVYTGERIVDIGQFLPFVPKGLRQGFLEAPFTLNMYLCPACFHTTTALNEQSRMEVMNATKKVLK